MMHPSAPPPFLDVHDLLERSMPKARAGWGWYVVGTVLLVSMLVRYFGGENAALGALADAIVLLLMLGALGTMMVLSWRTAKMHRAEQQQLEAVEELIQLRRWPEAAAVLQQLLSRPMRIHPMRIQALIFLTSVLARYHRFGDAMTVQDYLLQHVQLDPATDHGLRLARAMSMLREDHLTDAHRAINDLRRSDRARESGGLALVEMYRDVKTGHPEEAIRIFEERTAALRDQLGHRFGDAYVLLAKAYDLLSKPDDAQRAYERATLLSPQVELHRRYPETAALAERYQSSPWPQGAGGSQ
jgi:tetratricopeptide (TPR) repeat protein